MRCSDCEYNRFYRGASSFCAFNCPIEKDNLFSVEDEEVTVIELPIPDDVVYIIKQNHIYKGEIIK